MWFFALSPPIRCQLNRYGHLLPADWVMINSSYKSLMNVLNGFTRAAAAAQRIITLLNSSPDIDPHTGAVLPGGIKGELELRDVHFA